MSVLMLSKYHRGTRLGEPDLGFYLQFKSNRYASVPNIASSTGWSVWSLCLMGQGNRLLNNTGISMLSLAR